MITKIEVDFALPVELTGDEMMQIHKIVDAAARRTETKELVHWASGIGSKPHLSLADSRFLGKEPEEGAPERGEPTFDDSVYYIETTARERYESEVFKP